ncbi:hypothetical protein Ciccas_012699 [Cichlidogyrus casuarinus]|uniref:FAS1 domain-containing protein n=1 Tax=Cichlidogyrus casuarinus TaxID=1844966 RepID=A0ABD2PP08_9PLAT
MLFLDCSEILDSDYECPNGVVHLIRKPLLTDGYETNLNVLEMLKRDPETKQFAGDLSKEDADKLASTLAGTLNVTVLAPNSKKWEETRGKYKGDVLAKIAANHIIYENDYCLASLIRKGTVNTAPGMPLTVKRKDLPDKRYTATIESVCPTLEVTVPDLFQPNGVIHKIDGVLLPVSMCAAAPACHMNTPVDYKGEVPACLEDVDKFWNYLKECDLYVEEGKKYELAIPVNRAFEWFKNYAPFSDQYKRFMEDKVYRCRTIRYHIIPAGEKPRILSGEMNRTVHWRTNNKDDGVAPLWQSIYYGSGASPYSAPGDHYFHYGRVIDKTPYAYPNAWISRIDRLLVFSETNITDVVRTREDFKITNTLFGKTKYPDYLKTVAPRNLYFVVVDEGMLTKFDAEGNIKNPKIYIPVQEGDGSLEREMEQSMKDKYKDDIYFDEGSAYNFSLHHTFPNYYWAGDIGYYNYDQKYLLFNYFNTRFELRRTKEGDKDLLRVGLENTPIQQWSKVIQYNIPARDGMIWVLDKPLPCNLEFCQPRMEVSIVIYELAVVTCRTDKLEASGLIHKTEFNKMMKTVAGLNPRDCAEYLLNRYPNRNVP